MAGKYQQSVQTLTNQHGKIAVACFPQPQPVFVFFLAQRRTAHFFLLVTVANLNMASNSAHTSDKTPAQKRQETMLKRKLQEQAELRELEASTKGDIPGRLSARRKSQ